MCSEQQNSLWWTPLLFAWPSQPTWHGAGNISLGEERLGVWQGQLGQDTVLQHLPIPLPLCLLQWWKAPDQHLTRGSKTFWSSPFLVGHGYACTMLHSSTVSSLQREKGLAGLWHQCVDFQRRDCRVTFSRAHLQHQENTELWFCVVLIYRPGTVLQSMRGEKKKK